MLGQGSSEHVNVDSSILNEGNILTLCSQVSKFTVMSASVLLLWFRSS